jgi:hypothetical protein
MMNTPLAEGVHSLVERYGLILVTLWANEIQ